MSDPRDQAMRAALGERMAKIIKRQGYTERHIVQILRATSEKAAAIHAGQLDGFSTDELRKMVDVLS